VRRIRHRSIHLYVVGSRGSQVLHSPDGPFISPGVLDADLLVREGGLVVTSFTGMWPRRAPRCIGSSAVQNVHPVISAAQIETYLTLRVRWRRMRIPANER
jgi:hypothetical protein